MNFIKKFFAGILIIVMCVSMAACSSSNNGTAPEASTIAVAATAAAPASTASSEPVNIRILSSLQSENPEGPLEKSISDAYTKLHPNITFEYISVKSNEYLTKLTAMGTAGDMVDIFQNSYNNLPTTVDLNLSEDLNSMFDKEYLDGFEPHILAEATYDGKLLFMPIQSMPAALLYRSDWFKEKGLTAPKTWDDLIKCGQTLTNDTDGDGKIDRYGFALIATKDSSAGTRFLPILRSFGCRELYYEDGKWKTEVGNDAFKKACQTYADFDIKYNIAQPGAIETSYSEAATLLVSGKAAMMITGSNALGTIYTQNPDLKGKLASCDIPAGTQHATSPRSLGYSIYNGSKHKDICEEYLKFCLEEENAMKWTTVSYRVPTRTEYLDNPVLQGEDMKGFTDALKISYSWPQFLGTAKCYEIIGSVYQALITGSSDIDAASEKARKQMEELIASYE
jgi:multiple sugar transport system substrate-binding protein